MGGGKMGVNMNASRLDLDQLYAFIVKAAKNTYAGGGGFAEQSERPGFHELLFDEGEWHYRDSFTGWYRSRGSEVVRYGTQPVWTSSYGGGVEVIDAQQTPKIFKFLKQALSVDNKGFASFRGPINMRLGPWEYAYEQAGSIEEFVGYEEILFQSKLVFTHRIIGGIVIAK